jgi:hypothetical protein
MRSVFYRVQGSAGPWLRVVGEAPFQISGLDAGETYEFDDGVQPRAIFYREVGSSDWFRSTGPTVALTNGVDYEFDDGTGQVIALRPVAPADIAVPTAALTVAAPSPAVATGASAQVPVAALAIAAPLPAIATGGSVQVPVASLAVAAPVPAVATGGSVQVPAAALAIAAQAPTISAEAAPEIPADAFQNFTDLFPGSSLDGAKWSTSGYTGTVTVSGGIAKIPCRNDYAGGMASAVSTWDLTNSVVAWRFGFTRTNALESKNGIISLERQGTSGADRIRFGIDDGTLIADYQIGGVNTQLRKNVTYAPATHAYQRIHEDNGTVYMDWSTDGENWTNYASTTAISFAITDMYVNITCGDWLSTDGTFDISEFNQTPYQVGATEAPAAYLSYMPAVYYVTGMGTQTFATASMFDGDELEFSVSGVGSTGITINSSTGVVSVPTTSAFDWTTITVTAENGLGSDSVTIPVCVYAVNKTVSSDAAFSGTSVSAGDVVAVRKGTYTSAQSISGWSGSNSSNKTKVIAYPGEQVTFDARSLTGADMLQLRTADNIEIRGFKFIDDGGCRFGFYGDNAQNLVVEGNEFCYFLDGAFSMDYSTGGGQTRGAGWTVRYNRIHHNTVENRNADWTAGAVGQSGWGRGIFGDFRGDSLIEKNLVHENWGEGIGILSTTGTTARENIVWDNYSIQIYLDNADEVLVEENIVFHTGDTNYYRFGVPAPVCESSHEFYDGDSDYWNETTVGNDVINNRYLSGMDAPGYFVSDPAAFEDDGPSVYTPNTTFSTVEPRWMRMPNMYGFPSLREMARGRTGASNTTSHPITLPLIVPGELMVIGLSSDGSATVSINTGASSSGWTINASAANGSNNRLTIVSKIAEEGDTLTLTTSASEQSSHIAMSFHGASSIQVSTSATGSSTTANAPSFSPSGGSAKYLWLAVMGADSTAVPGAGPIGCYDFYPQVAAGTGGASVAAAMRFDEVATYDPAAFGTMATDTWVAFTIALAP